MTSMQGDQDDLGGALQRAYLRRWKELKSRSPSELERAKSDAVEAQLVSQGRYHRFLSIKDAKLFFDDMSKEEGDAELLKTFLLKLGNVMRADGFEVGDNDMVPAGFTYLFQFAAHDIVQSSSQVLTFGDVETPVVNRRREGLGLETLFDGGPLGCPFVFEGLGSRRHEGDNQVPQRMRVGALLDKQCGPPKQKRDLLRAQYIRHEKEPKLSTLVADCAYVADIRNEDNFILAQLTILFHEYFNIALGKLGESVDFKNRIQDVAMDVIRKNYRTIIEKDLLPRILHKKVVVYYENGGEFIDNINAFSVSREFAFAAVRVGHSMVRQTYALNTGEDAKNIGIGGIVAASSSRPPVGLDPVGKWGIDWGLFFSDKKEKPDAFNFAKRFSLFAAGTLSNSDLVSPPILTPGGVSGPFGLHGRDIVRAAKEGLWNVPALIQKIAQIAPPFRDMVGGRNPTDHVKQTMEAVLFRDIDGNAEPLLEPELLRIAVTDPPLLPFLLAEASKEAKGTLGPLGSIIVGEVFYRWLRENDENETQKEWSEKIAIASAHVHSKDEPETMVKLIEFITNNQ